MYHSYTKRQHIQLWLKIKTRCLHNCMYNIVETDHLSTLEITEELINILHI